MKSITLCVEVLVLLCCVRATQLSPSLVNILQYIRVEIQKQGYILSKTYVAATKQHLGTFNDVVPTLQTTTISIVIFDDENDLKTHVAGRYGAHSVEISLPASQNIEVVLDDMRIMIPHPLEDHIQFAGLA